MEHEFLHLDDLLNDPKRKIFIVNNSLKANLMIVLEMKDRNGRGRPLKIPPTNIPIELTALFSRDILRESSDLRVALTKTNILLMDEKVAMKILATPEAKAEMKTFQMSAYSDSAPANPVSDSLAKLGKKAKKVMDKSDVLKKAETKDAVNVRIKAVIGSFKAKEKNAKETLSQILRLKSVLTRDDLSFIMQECAEDQNIRKFAEQALAEMEAGPEQPFEK